MPPPFFPNLPFGWTFYAVLMAFLLVAAYIDSSTMVVPKWVSLPTLAVGLVFNIVRGAWMGTEGEKIWLFEPNGALTGAADGFLFALIGFLAGFGIFFVMWILGVCRGGDVKLFAAVSAWVGPVYFLWILVLSTIILFVLSGVKIVFTILASSPQAVLASRTDKKSKATLPRDPRRARGTTYAFPLALATALVLLWVIGEDLKQPLPQSAADAPVDTPSTKYLLAAHDFKRDLGA